VKTSFPDAQYFLIQNIRRGKGDEKEIEKKSVFPFI